MNTAKRLQKRTLLCLSVLVGLVSVALLILFLPRLFGNRLEKADQALVTHEMAVAYPTVQRLVRPLGIIVASPGPTTCGSGDPALYAFECVATAKVTFATDSTRPLDPPTVAQRLQTLDKQLEADGWRPGANDFRKQSDQNSTNWADAMARYDVTIEYWKGTCDFEATLTTSARTAANNASGPNFFACAKDDGAPTEEE